MKKYNTFLAAFVIFIIALVVFLAIYIQVIFSFVLHADQYNENNSLEVLSRLFSPGVIISIIALAISSLVYRIMGIVYVAANKTVSDGEKVLWIIGFIIFGFITAIQYPQITSCPGKYFPSVCFGLQKLHLL